MNEIRNLPLTINRYLVTLPDNFNFKVPFWVKDYALETAKDLLPGESPSFTNEICFDFESIFLDRQFENSYLITQNNLTAFILSKKEIPNLNAKRVESYPGEQESTNSFYSIPKKELYVNREPNKNGDIVPWFWEVGDYTDETVLSLWSKKRKTPGPDVSFNVIKARTIAVSHKISLKIDREIIYSLENISKCVDFTSKEEDKLRRMLGLPSKVLDKPNKI